MEGNFMGIFYETVYLDTNVKAAFNRNEKTFTYIKYKFKGLFCFKDTGFLCN